jgi:hypothetical protein
MATSIVHSGIMHGKLKGAIAATTPQGVAVGDVVYPAGNIAHGLAHKQTRHPARELHDLDSAPDLAAGILRILAVLQGHQVPELLGVLLEQHLVTEQNLNALHHRGPRPPLKGRARRPNGLVHVVAGGEGCLGYDLSRGRVVDRLGLPAVAGHPLPADEVPYPVGLSGYLHPSASFPAGSPPSAASLLKPVSAHEDFSRNLFPLPPSLFLSAGDPPAASPRILSICRRGPAFHTVSFGHSWKVSAKEGWNLEGPQPGCLSDVSQKTLHRVLYLAGISIFLHHLVYPRVEGDGVNALTAVDDVFVSVMGIDGVVARTPVRGGA